MAYICPIENVWAYIKKKFEEEFENLLLLKQRIITIWNTISPQTRSK